MTLALVAVVKNSKNAAEKHSANIGGQSAHSDPNLSSPSTLSGPHMNRRKKVNSILKRKAKKAKKMLTPSNKPKYVSKADRAKLDEQAHSGTDNSSESE